MSAATLRRLIVIGLIALWEILPRTGLIPELFLPSLSSTLAAGWNEAGEYGHALAVTLYEVAISMAFACGGGILLGAVVGSLPRPRILIMPMVSSLYAVPLVILYPVFTVWLGIGSESKIAFASIYGFLPTMLATAAGIQTIDPQLLLAARSMGATLSQRLVRVIIPAAIPTVLSGLRVGGALVIVGVVVSEMLISSAGIGYLISRYRTILDSPRVFAGVLLVLFLAIAFNAAIRWIERKAAIWQTGILAERGIKTTFFVIGEKLADPARRDLAARAHGEGHWIGNHTFTHSVPLGEQPDRNTAENEIGRTQSAISDLAHPQ